MRRFSSPYDVFYQDEWHRYERLSGQTNNYVAKDARNELRMMRDHFAAQGITPEVRRRRLRNTVSTLSLGAATVITNRLQLPDIMPIVLAGCGISLAAHEATTRIINEENENHMRASYLGALLDFHIIKQFMVTDQQE